MIARSDLSKAAELIHHICCVAGSASLIEDARNEGRPPLHLAITDRNTPALFNWLVKILSYQGISDRAASRYLQQHGSITQGLAEQAIANFENSPRTKFANQLQTTPVENKSRSKKIE